MPYKWIDNNRATFEFEGKKYGICVERRELSLIVSKRTYVVANVSFGIIKHPVFHNANDLDTRLTRVNKPRTVMSTVAEACLANSSLKRCDLVSLAAADQVREKRALLYSLALSEIIEKDSTFSHSFAVKARNGVILNILSRIKFSVKEQAEIAKDLGIDKL